MSEEDIEKKKKVAKKLLHRRLTVSQINECLINEFGSGLPEKNLLNIRLSASIMDSLLPPDFGKPISSGERERKAEYAKNRNKVAKKLSPPSSSLPPPPPPPPHEDD
jgi:hypothetical protein